MVITLNTGKTYKVAYPYIIRVLANKLEWQDEDDVSHYVDIDRVSSIKKDE